MHAAVIWCVWMCPGTERLSATTTASHHRRHCRRPKKTLTDSGRVHPPPSPITTSTGYKYSTRAPSYHRRPPPGPCPCPCRRCRCLCPSSRTRAPLTRRNPRRTVTPTRPVESNSGGTHVDHLGAPCVIDRRVWALTSPFAQEDCRFLLIVDVNYQVPEWSQPCLSCL